MPKPCTVPGSPAGLFLNALKRWPDRPAFVLSGQALSYREAGELIARIAARMDPLPGGAVCLQVADHGLWALALIAAELAGKALGSGPVLQDSELQRAIQSGQSLPLPKAEPRTAPVPGCEDGDVFANLLPYSVPGLIENELCACLSVGGCLWFCEGPRGFVGQLGRIRPHCLVLDRAGLEALLDASEAPDGGLDRLRRVFCVEPPLPAQRRRLSQLGLLPEI